MRGRYGRGGFGRPLLRPFGPPVGGFGLFGWLFAGFAGFFLGKQYADQQQMQSTAAEELRKREEEVERREQALQTKKTPD